MSTPASEGGPSARARWLERGRALYDGSWVQDVVTHFQVLDGASWTVEFGAELLWSVLPLLILLSSLASARVDAALSRHIGATGQGDRVVQALFRNTPTFSAIPIATGLLFALAGSISVVASIQVLYERAFDLEHRGWRDIHRFLAWLLILVAALTAEDEVSKPVQTAGGVVLAGLLRLLAALLFFWWTMHFLLAGRTPWRALIRPAAVTAALWVVLAIFSAISLSSSLVDDSKLYGTIGVVFTLLTWFVLIGTVLLLGAAVGAVWQKRRGQGFPTPDPGARAPRRRRRGADTG